MKIRPTLWSRLAAMLVAVAALVAATGPLAAGEFCVAESGTAKPGAALDFDCGDDRFKTDAETVWLRASVPGPADAREGNLLLSGDITRFDAMEVTLVGDSGETFTRRLEHQDFAEHAAWGGSHFGMPLNWARGPIASVLVKVEQPWGKDTLSDLHIQPETEFLRDDQLRGFIISFLVGASLTALVASLIVFAAARDRVILQISCLIGFGLLYVLASSNLLLRPFESFPLELRWRMSFGAAAAIVLALGVFVPRYLEPRHFPRALKLMWYGSVAVTAVCATLPMLFADQLRTVGSTIYHAGFLPQFTLFFVIATQAAVRGSRSALHLLVALGAGLASGFTRVFGQLGAYLPTALTDLSLHIGITLSTVVLLIPVSVRLFRLRRERDLSLREAEIARHFAERDPLTGLWNRRGFERKAATKKWSGMAILDLDRFKSVNDTFGHDVGDRVLLATARALRTDADIEACRFGGEEFVLLVRGDDAEARVEKMRREIEESILTEVPALDWPQTASAGFVDLSANGISPDKMLKRADAALYRAKTAGRNQLISDGEPPAGEGRIRSIAA